MSTPQPFSFAPTGKWEGDDGPWSTFSIAVGTPPQGFRVLPATSASEIWIPYGPGCEGILANIADCGMLRGIDDFNNEPSRGFQPNSSPTWDQIGIYTLNGQQYLWSTSNSTDYGLYGNDVVTLNQSGSEAPLTLQGQTVAGVSTEAVWLGSLGMGPAVGQFSTESSVSLSLLDEMQLQNLIPSSTAGYTAGAAYLQSHGSLIFGGYDQSRSTPSNLSLPISIGPGQPLPLYIKSIIADNLPAGTLSLLPDDQAVSSSIDSMVAGLGLPQSVCDMFAQTFNLTYDPSTALYLVNDTTHQSLLQLNPSITFTLAENATSTATTNIVLPYAAFDIQAGIPLFNQSTNYFPIHVAQNQTQLALGRTLLQEAYVFVDWGRQNFTIGQAIHHPAAPDIISVSAPPSQNGKPALTAGAIAGVAIGSVALVALVTALLVFLFCRRRRRRQGVQLRTLTKPIATPTCEMGESEGTPLEMGEPEFKHELMSTSLTELAGSPTVMELDANKGEKPPRMEKGIVLIHELP